MQKRRERGREEFFLSAWIHLTVLFIKFGSSRLKLWSEEKSVFVLCNAGVSADPSAPWAPAPTELLGQRRAVPQPPHTVTYGVWDIIKIHEKRVKFPTPVFCCVSM